MCFFVCYDSHTSFPAVSIQVLERVNRVAVSGQYLISALALDYLVWPPATWDCRWGGEWRRMVTMVLYCSVQSYICYMNSCKRHQIRIKAGIVSTFRILATIPNIEENILFLNNMHSRVVKDWRGAESRQDTHGLDDGGIVVAVSEELLLGHHAVLVLVHLVKLDLSLKKQCVLCVPLL